MKALLVAVAATALLAPLAATAQDGGGWRGRGGGERSAAAQNPGGGGQGRGGEGRSWGGGGGGGEGRGWGGGRQARTEQPAQAAPAQAAPVQRFERAPSQAQAQRGGGGQEWRRAQGGETGRDDRQRQALQRDDSQRQAQAAQREAWQQRQAQAGQREDRQRQGQAGQYQRGGDQRQGQYRNGYDQRQGQYRGSDQRQGFYQGGQRYDGQRFDGQRYDGRRDDNRYRGDAGRYQDNRRGQQWSRNWRSNSQYYGGRSFQRMRVSPFIWPRGYSSVRFSFGQRLPSVFLAPNYFVGDYFSMGLPYPPPGAEWVRVGADALLVDTFTGEILDVVQDAFYW